MNNKKINLKCFSFLIAAVLFIVSNGIPISAQETAATNPLRQKIYNFSDYSYSSVSGSEDIEVGIVADDANSVLKFKFMTHNENSDDAVNKTVYFDYTVEVGYTYFLSYKYKVSAVDFMDGCTNTAHNASAKVNSYFTLGSAENTAITKANILGEQYLFGGQWDTKNNTEWVTVKAYFTVTDEMAENGTQLALYMSHYLKEYYADVLIDDVKIVRVNSIYDTYCFESDVEYWSLNSKINGQDKVSAETVVDPIDNTNTVLQISGVNYNAPVLLTFPFELSGGKTYTLTYDIYSPKKISFTKNSGNGIYVSDDKAALAEENYITELFDDGGDIDYNYIQGSNEIGKWLTKTVTFTVEESYITEAAKFLMLNLCSSEQAGESFTVYIDNFEIICDEYHNINVLGGQPRIAEGEKTAGMRQVFSVDYNKLTELSNEFDGEIYVGVIQALANSEELTVKTEGASYNEKSMDAITSGNVTDGIYKFAGYVKNIQAQTAASNVDAVGYIRLSREGKNSYFYSEKYTNNFYNLRKSAQLAGENVAALPWNTKIDGVDLARYQIVVGVGADFETKNQAMRLRDGIASKLGYILNVVEDSKSAAQYEIIVGETARRDSSALEETRYEVSFADGDIYLSAGHYLGIASAIDAMLSEINVGSISGNTFNISGTLDASVIPLNWSEDYNLVWNDEFSGNEIDMERWSLSKIMSQSDVVFSSDSGYVDTSDGVHSIGITYDSETQKYTYGYGLGSYSTMNYQNGYIEMRAKIPFSELGVWPAFWLVNWEADLAKSAGCTMPELNFEIDVFENLSTADTIRSNLHKYDASTGIEYKNLISDNSAVVTNTSDWHTYGLLWEGNSLTFYLDGEVYCTYTDEDNGLTSPVALKINNGGYTEAYLANSNDTTHSALSEYFEAGNSRLDFSIDYVRLYQNDEGVLITGNPIKN